MNDFIAYLQNRIDDTRKRLQHVTDQIQRATTEREMLIGDLQGYERALAAETRSDSATVTDTPVRPTTQPNGAVHLDEPQEYTENKAEFARQFVRSHAQYGSTPSDIFKGFQDAGIPIKKPYIYALVQRLQKQKAIRQRRGRYYPEDPAPTESELPTLQ